MKPRILATLCVVVCSLLSGCFSNDVAPVSPCYPFLYSQVIGSTRYEESYSYNQSNKTENMYSETKTGSAASTSSSSVYLYDKNGVLMAVEYPDAAYAYTYDKSGRISVVNYNNNSGITTQKQEFTYNASNQVTKRQYYSLSGSTLAKSTYYTYEYPNTGTKNYSKRSLFNASDVLQSFITYTYDSKPNPWTLVSLFPNVVQTNNILKQINSNASGSSTVTWTWTYTYSAKGFPLKYKASNGTGSEEQYEFQYMNCLK